MWPCIVTRDRASWHVIVHRDMWPCIVTCNRASWHVTVHRDRIPYNKSTRCTNFSNLFWKWNPTCFGKFLCPSSGVIPSWLCFSKTVYRPVWHIPLLSVQWITPDDGQRNCPKHVEFHFQNKFEKSVHLVGFITDHPFNTGLPSSGCLSKQKNKSPARQSRYFKVP
jgi:hypothetical protein